MTRCFIILHNTRRRTARKKKRNPRAPRRYSLFACSLRKLGICSVYLLAVTSPCNRYCRKKKKKGKHSRKAVREIPVNANVSRERFTNLREHLTNEIMREKWVTLLHLRWFRRNGCLRVCKKIRFLHSITFIFLALVN